MADKNQNDCQQLQQPSGKRSVDMGDLKNELRKRSTDGGNNIGRDKSSVDFGDLKNKLRKGNGK